MIRILILIILFNLVNGIYAQFTREQAIEKVVTEIVGINNLQSNHTYSRYESMQGGDTLWLDSHVDYLMAPFSENWIFFIDLSPIVHWAHPCQYIFVSAETGDYEVFDNNWPPHPFFYNYQIFQEQWEWILSIGINDITMTGSPFTIYPNPSSHHIHINLYDFTHGRISVYLMDLTGQTLQKQIFSGNHWNTIKLQVDELPAGLYFVILEINDSDPCCQKFLIMR